MKYFTENFNSFFGKFLYGKFHIHLYGKFKEDCLENFNSIIWKISNQNKYGKSQCLENISSRKIILMLHGKTKAKDSNICNGKYTAENIIFTRNKMLTIKRKLEDSYGRLAWKIILKIGMEK